MLVLTVPIRAIHKVDGSGAETTSGLSESDHSAADESLRQAESERRARQKSEKEVKDGDIKFEEADSSDGEGQPIFAEEEKDVDDDSGDSFVERIAVFPPKKRQDAGEATKKVKKLSKGKKKRREEDRNSGSRPVVMVVDDSQLIRIGMRSMLKRSGYEVICCVNGLDALEKYVDLCRKEKVKQQGEHLKIVDEKNARYTPTLVTAHKSGMQEIAEIARKIASEKKRKKMAPEYGSLPIIIMMDFLMPIMSGIESAFAIRAFELKENLPMTPILGMSATANSDDVSEMLQLPLTEFYLKPLQPEMMKAILKGIVTETREFGVGDDESGGSTEALDCSQVHD